MQIRTVALALAFWLVIFLVIGGSGAIGRLPPPLPQLVLAALVLLLLAAYFRSKVLRGWLPRNPTGTPDRAAPGAKRRS
jgi:hypothetical protein